jgi:hypothetical protein
VGRCVVCFVVSCDDDSDKAGRDIMPSVRGLIESWEEWSSLARDSTTELGSCF